MKFVQKYLSLAIIISILLSVVSCDVAFAKSKSKKKTKEAATQTVNLPTPELKIKSNKPKSWQPEILIGLFTSTNEVKVSASLPAVLFDSEYAKRIKNISSGKELTISVIGGKIQVDGKPLNLEKIDLRPQNDADLKNMQTTINGKKYFGGVKCIVRNGRLVVINISTVEEYLRSVLPKEMSPSFNDEALKAQAVAARTFALVNRKRHLSEGYDLCDKSHCQVYSGVDSVNERTDNAIAATFGEVLYYNGKLIQSVFHTDSGGMTENAVDVWNVDQPYLRAATEIETKTQAWTVIIPIEDFSNKLAAAGKGVGTVQFVKSTNLEIGKLTSDRSTSGRVKEVTVVGDKGEIKVSGTALRSILGLNSTLFEIGISGNDLVITGYGRGHGVGMSQMGAQAFAEHGYTYDKILSHYYKGTTLKRLY